MRAKQAKLTFFKSSMLAMMILVSFGSASQASYFIRGTLDDVRNHISLFENFDKFMLENIISGIEEYENVPYRYGGSSKKGTDCSGFVMMLFKNFFGITLPHGSRNQVALGETVGMDELKPGDLLFFKIGKEIGHVGIYLSNGYFVSAESKIKGIGISHLDSQYWKTRFVKAKRIIPQIFPDQYSMFDLVYPLS
ncbi:MAG: C40 family peptidase [Candidatus Delongbacteria bacterium]|nr:C40 family peptidase [Candidatus Delongbacteria bacterium]